MKPVPFALAVLLFASCSGDRATTPEGAVQRLVLAARTGDRAGVYQRLGSQTRARIDALAAASRKMTGRVAMKPEDFLSVGWAPPAWEPEGMRTLRREGLTAEVEIYAAGGDRHTVNLVREGDEWKVELPGR